METICICLHGNYESALQKIMNTIPCFVTEEYDGSVAIHCREEDAAFVERELQDFV